MLNMQRREGSGTVVLGRFQLLLLSLLLMWVGFLAGIYTHSHGKSSENSEISNVATDAASAGGKSISSSNNIRTGALAGSTVVVPNTVNEASKNIAEVSNAAVSPATNGVPVYGLISPVNSFCHMRLRDRRDIPVYLNQLNLVGEGVEIGVRDGDFSEYVLSVWKGKKLHLVDPWENQKSDVYKDFSNVKQDEQEQRLQHVKDRLAKFGVSRYEIHRSYSVDAAKTIPDESLDYVYVDARHDYAGVMEDLQAWWPKLKKGGLLSGHDFVPDGMLYSKTKVFIGDFGVQKAVMEFAMQKGKEVMSISSKRRDGGREEPQHVDGGWTTWYFLK